MKLCRHCNVKTAYLSSQSPDEDLIHPTRFQSFGHSLTSPNLVSQPFFCFDHRVIGLGLVRVCRTTNKDHNSPTPSWVGLSVPQWRIPRRVRTPLIARNFLRHTKGTIHSRTWSPQLREDKISDSQFYLTSGCEISNYTQVQNGISEAFPSQCTLK